MLRENLKIQTTVLTHVWPNSPSLSQQCLDIVCCTMTNLCLLLNLPLQFLSLLRECQLGSLHLRKNSFFLLEKTGNLACSRKQSQTTESLRAAQLFKPDKPPRPTVFILKFGSLSIYFTDEARAFFLFCLEITQLVLQRVTELFIVNLQIKKREI